MSTALKDFESLPETLFESVEFPPLDQQSVSSLTDDVRTGLITSGDTAQLNRNLSYVQKPYLNEKQQLVRNPARVKSWHAENIKDKFVRRKNVERYSTSGDPFVRNRERVERQHHTIIPRPVTDNSRVSVVQAVNKRVSDAKANDTSMLSESTVLSTTGGQVESTPLRITRPLSESVKIISMTQAQIHLFWKT